MELIPAIDILDGKCVRLNQGDYNSQKIYNQHPLEVAYAFEDHGIERLHLVDLDGAKAQHVVNYKVLEQIATETDLIIDFGGGLKDDEDLHIAFSSGANQVTAGSITIQKPKKLENWIDIYGPEKIILGADIKDERIAIQGWTKITDITIEAHLERHIHDLGLSYCICTDVAKDGMLEGSSIELYKKLISEFTSMRLIASGGVSSIDELNQLKEIGCYGAIIGKAIYEGHITLQQLEQWIEDAE